VRIAELDSMDRKDAEAKESSGRLASDEDAASRESSRRDVRAHRSAVS
jgi:hypothetical protein